MSSGDKKSIWGQVRRNAVALISLVIALSTLSYSTWRNEKSEDNRNHRQAAFEILLKLNQLQQVVFHRRYDMDATDKGNPRLGWTIVLTIDDLAQLVETPLPEKSSLLREVWSDRDVVGIPCENLVLGLGAVHCLSQQEPSAKT